MREQQKLLEKKLDMMKNVEIGRRLGVHQGVELQELPITDYNFYKPFFDNPSQEAFMYPLDEYVKTKTSGTMGTEKWYLTPKNAILKAFKETGLPLLLSVFHDGEKITLEYGANFYVNTGPAPYMSGTALSLGVQKGQIPFFKVVPNMNLPFKDKLQYFILNYDMIDGALLSTHILVSQIMPILEKPIQLKGLFITEGPVAENYMNDIIKFAGITPRTTYVSTETHISAVASVQHPLGFFFDWRRGIFEFILVDEKEGRETPIPISEVKVRNVYRLLFTSLDSELTRIDTKDAFKCIAKGDDVLNVDFPVFKVHSRLDNTISLQNFTRIDEDEVTAALRDAKVPFYEFTARVEVEDALEYLALYIELFKAMKVENIRDTVQKQLCAKDKDYRYLTDCYDYVPLKIHLLPRGSFDKYMEFKGGAIEKVNRINMRPEDFKRLIESAGIE